MTRLLARLPADTAPVVGFAAATATALLAGPAIASQLASQFGLPPSKIGLYFTVEQAGMCLAAVPAMWWLKHASWRRVAAIAMGVFILVNLVSSQVSDFHWLLPLRAISSLCGGSLMVLSMTLAGRSAERERLFALWTLGQLAVGAALLYLLPRAFDRFGLSFLYLLLAALMAANIPLLRHLPARVGARPEGRSAQRPVPAWTVALGVGGVLFYYIGFGGLWPFMTAIANSGGATAVASGGVLALASLCGMAGALLASARARHGGRIVLAFGYAVHATAILVLLFEPSLLRFTAAACLLKGASNFTLPFILGRVARLSDDGRLMGLTNMAIGGGLAIGPLISGGVIEGAGGLAALIGLTVAWMLASSGLVLSLGLKPPAPISASGLEA